MKRTTDQKVGGSNPSGRATVLPFVLGSVDCFAVAPPANENDDEHDDQRHDQ